MGNLFYFDAIRAVLMRIILDMQQTSSGRLQGTGRTKESVPGQQFEGILELIGLLEACLKHSPDHTPSAAPTENEG
jgi:hypothetical protein